MYLVQTNIRRIAEFLVYSNIWIAICAVSMAFLCYRVFELQLDFFLLAFVFTSTVFTYTFQRFAKIKSLQAFSGRRMEWMTAGIVKVAVILALSGLSSLVLLFFIEKKVILLLIPLGAISVLYVGKFPFRDFYNLRDIPFMKAHFIAIVWAGMVVGMPVLQESRPITAEVFLMSAAVYGFIFSLAIVFDIRDVEVDEPQKRTVPQVLGKRLAALAAIALCLLSVMAVGAISTEVRLPLAVVFLVTVLLSLKSVRQKDDLYFSFWVDGLILLFGLSGLFI